MNTALDARDEEGNKKLKCTHKKSTDTPRFRQKLNIITGVENSANTGDKYVTRKMDLQAQHKPRHLSGKDVRDPSCSLLTSEDQPQPMKQLSEQTSTAALNTALLSR